MMIGNLQRVCNVALLSCAIILTMHATPDVALQNPAQNDDYYKSYLAKYYPKVFVIRSQFAAMSPSELEAALRDIVAVLAYDPWFYFANKPEEIKVTRYWECIIDQLNWLGDFLSSAWIDQGTHKIYLPEGIQFNYAKSTSKKISLEKYLTRPGCTVLHDFYALCFDYNIKLFNEGILLQDIGQAAHYFMQLEAILEQLRDSAHEADYTEALRTAHELLILFKQRLGIHEA